MGRMDRTTKMTNAAARSLAQAGGKKEGNGRPGRHRAREPFPYSLFATSNPDKRSGRFRLIRDIAVLTGRARRTRHAGAVHRGSHQLQL